MPDNDFDRFMKGKLDEASVEPPAFLWNKIESRLPASKPWYSRYKYLLLLLLLGFTSGTSMFLYKNTFLKNSQGSKIALNKRLLKDDTNNSGWATKNKNTLTTGKENTNTASQKAADKKQPSVASFYDKNKSSETNGSNAFSKRAALLQRLQVKDETEGKHVSDKNRSANLAVNTSGTKSSKAVSKNTVSSAAWISATDNKTTKTQNTGDSKNTANNTIIQPGVSGTSQPANTTGSNNALAQQGQELQGSSNAALAVNDVVNTQDKTQEEEDVTKPIVEPFHDQSTLTASVVPVKVNVPPLSPRDLMRSMIEPEKLEKLDIESQAAGIEDLNPNKEKMLKNLKQFAGYNINQGFHIGALIGINNNWLNHKEFSADENTLGIKPMFDLGKSYGINIGYDYKDRWGIQMEWQISEQGQKYKVTQSNGSFVKEVNLLYVKFPFMMKYKHFFLNNYNSKPIAFSFLFGPQIDFLMKKEVLLDGQKMEKTPKYNVGEFGLVTGFDFDLFMTRNLSLTVGGRGGFSTSMKRGAPMQFQLGVTTQINFRFPKKLKQL